MRRREFIHFLGCSFLVCPSVALAQQGGKQTTIGWLSPDNLRDTGYPAKMLQTFRQRLENLGHIEGRDVYRISLRRPQPRPTACPRGGACRAKGRHHRHSIHASNFSRPQGYQLAAACLTNQFANIPKQNISD
jgi:hypothetical protein